MNNDLFEKVRMLIDDYCYDEFGYSASFEDLSYVGLAYTTITDEEYEIQVVANLIDFSIDAYILDVLVRSVKYDSLDDLIENELKCLDFENLIDYTDEEVEYAIKACEFMGN